MAEYKFGDGMKKIFLAGVGGTRQNSNSSPPLLLMSDARLLAPVLIGYFRALGGNDLKGAGRR